MRTILLTIYGYMIPNDHSKKPKDIKNKTLNNT